MKKLVTFFLLLLSSLTILKAVVIAKSQPLAIVPFEMQYQHIFFQLTIKNSRPLNFIFDTGASMMVINPETAKELNLTAHGTLTAQGVGGLVSAPRYLNIPLKLKGVHIRTSAIGFSVKHLERRIGRTIDGIIGADYLSRFAIEINHDQSELRFFSFDDFSYTGKGQKIKLNMSGRIPTCRLTVQLPDGKKLSENFLIDTGAGHCLDFTTYFTQEYHLSAKFAKKYRIYTSGASTNKTYLEVARLPKLMLGKYTFENFPISLSSAKGGVLGNYQNGGILGNVILKKFNITLNYQTQRSYWEPNKLYEEAFKINCAGLVTQLTSDLKKIEIQQIIANSSAAKAGFQPGDLLLEINGKQIKAKDKVWLMELGTQAGKTLKVKIQRSNQVKYLVFTLKSMI